jgi:hypothetical protein
MTTPFCRFLSASSVVLIAMAGYAQDLQIKKNITVGGNVVSSTETAIKGARERTVNQSPMGNTITIQQCDLKRTVHINDQAQTYFIANDGQDDAAAKAAAMFGAAPAAQAAGGYITESTSIVDTGEHKTINGYAARHLKMKVSIQPSKTACSQQSQQFEVDGWYADIAREISSCSQQYLPPVRQTEGCNDRIIHKVSGSAKPGYPLTQAVTVHSEDGSTMQIGVDASEITKQDLPKELFDVPAGYREVKSLAELNSVPAIQAPQQATYAAPQQAAYAAAPQTAMPPAQAAPKGKSLASMMLNPAAAMAMGQKGMGLNPAAAMAMGQKGMGLNPGAAMAMAQSAAMGQQAGMNPQAMMGGANGFMMGQGMQPAGGAMTAAPQPLGPKAPGKIRVGVAPPDAQLGQGNNAGADYSTPIRNVEVALMSGPAIEIAALESHVALQLQAEAQQKQCDYILLSGVTVKHSSGGSFGKFMKIGQTAASLNPAVMMTKSMGTMVAAQTVASATQQMAAQQMQQQAISQLAGFNGQVKSKDDVTVEYQLVATGQGTPLVQNKLQGKAKSDGEDVLTPLLQQTANAVLTQVSTQASHK